MTSGAIVNPDKTFAALKPAALEELAGEAHLRRRDTDLDRAMRSDAAPSARMRTRRRPTLLLAGLATACAVAASAAVVVTAQDGAPPPRATGTPQAPPDARSLLLASAQTIERVPVRPGRYWYTRQRTQTRQDSRMERKGLKPGQRSKEIRLPFTVLLSGGQESWLSRTGRDRSRTITAIDVKMRFPTERDEAEWRRAGSPDLIEEDERRPSVNNYDIPLSHVIGNQKVRTDDLLKLPTDAGRLAAELRRRYQADVRESGGPQNVDPYPYYVWMTAQDLLGGPITPGTKAALYRVLADQPGVRSEGAATDQLGRRGVAVSMRVGGDARMEVRLIIDPRTGQLLAYESGERDAQGIPSLSMAYEAMGWVDTLGGRP